LGLGENIVNEKSYNFALKIIKYSRQLRDANEYVLSNQILKSGTSIGANINESIYSQSKKDFVNKLSIALKEANETLYWLKLIKDSNLISDKYTLELLKDIDEIIRLLVSIIKTTKKDIIEQ